MIESGRRSSDHPPPASTGQCDAGSNTGNADNNGLTVFPLFGDTPFLAWQHLHRKTRVLQHIHPSGKPVILLWDEVDDTDLLP